VNEELRKTKEHMTGLTDELRTHSLKEYISYLDNLKMILMTQEPVDEVIQKTGILL